MDKKNDGDDDDHADSDDEGSRCWLASITNVLTVAARDFLRECTHLLHQLV